jgi:hypothetical protein
MVHKLKIIFSFVSIFFISFVYANDLNTTQHIKPKLLYVKYKTYPKIVYTKQTFEVVIQANVLLPKYQLFVFSTDIKKSKNVDILTQDIIWYKKTDTLYETTLKYKAKNKKFSLPDINIKIEDIKDIIFDETILKKPKIIYRKIAINQQRYSNIIASSLDISSIKTKQYTNNKLLCVITIKAKNSNLEEFHLSTFKTQGIKNISLYDGIQTLYYYVIVPTHIKNIKFDYYNFKLNEFILVNIPISLEEELVSTQTNLNPYENDMTFYKNIALSIIVFIFIMIYYFTKRGKYFVVAVFFILFIINSIMPNKTMILKPSTKIYILPTTNSTVYKIIEESEKVEILNKKKNFIKILFKNKNIGWINEQN